MSLYSLNKDMLIKLITEIQQLHIREIDELKAVLTDNDFEKCSECKKYVKDYTSCGQCDFQCCESCAETRIQHYDSWNLSGVNMCSSCSKLFCHDCLTELDPIEPSIPCIHCGSLHCQKCKKNCLRFVKII